MDARDVFDELGERMSFDCEDRRLAGRRAKPVEQLARNAMEGPQVSARVIDSELSEALGA